MIVTTVRKGTAGFALLPHSKRVVGLNPLETAWSFSVSLPLFRVHMGSLSQSRDISGAFWGESVILNWP